MSRLLLSVVSLLVFGSVAAVVERPNFVFLFADAQRYDVLGVVQKEHGEPGRNWSRSTRGW